MFTVCSLDRVTIACAASSCYTLAGRKNSSGITKARDMSRRIRKLVKYIEGVCIGNRYEDMKEIGKDQAGPDL